jgi:transposase-like protein
VLYATEIGSNLDEQIAYALRQVEGGMPVADVCRKLGISAQTFYRWKKKFAGMGVAELQGVRLAKLSPAAKRHNERLGAT